MGARVSKSQNKVTLIKSVRSVRNELNSIVYNGISYSLMVKHMIEIANFKRVDLINSLECAKKEEKL